MQLSQIQQNAFRILERSGRRHRLSRIVEICLILLIAANVVAITLETVDSIHQKYAHAFRVFEWLSIMIFSVEYLLRAWACVLNPKYRGRKYPRLFYLFTPLALIDLLAILPFFLGFFFALDLRVLRVLRLLRIFKLARYSSAMTMLFEVFREEASTFIASFFILSVLLTLAASGAYLVEHMAQPDKFGSIPQAMWWAVVTLTTVGYGDVTPVTAVGKMFGAMIAVIGVCMAALPAGILASGLAEQLREKRLKMRNEFRHALIDGTVDANEQQKLEELRKKLGLSRRIMAAIQEEHRNDAELLQWVQCPHCGHDHALPTNRTRTQSKSSAQPKSG
ncbi:MAG: Ion transport protein [Rhodobacterales bacterium]|nr:MAG: Ion transport protein [Rhodobacterales bacterium]